MTLPWKPKIMGWGDVRYCFPMAILVVIVFVFGLICFVLFCFVFFFVHKIIWLVIQREFGKVFLVYLISDSYINYLSNIFTMSMLRTWWMIACFIDFWCFTPLSAIFQLYHGKLYHLWLRVKCTRFCYLQSLARTHAVLVIGLYGLLSNPTT
jgi:hypothetical protein